MKRSADVLSLKWLATLVHADEPNHSSHAEKWISAAGGFLGIMAVVWVSAAVLDHRGAALIVGSMGASAVLLFAVPHGALSQPWAVFGGHMISAFIGVTCVHFIDAPLLAAAAAVGISIGVMYYLHCIHPPGGATALVAVLGGEGVHALGYQFMFTPVLENVLIILAVAVVVNMPFEWRRYPAGWAHAKGPVEKEGVGEKALIAHSDLVYALSQLDSFIDVSEEDLIRIYTLAVHHTRDPVRCHQQGKACQDGDRDCLCRTLQGAQT